MFPGLSRRFDIPKEKEYFFSAAERSQIVDFILRRQRVPKANDSEEAKIFGVNRLVQDDVYKAAYPLHEPFSNRTESDLRSYLKEKWASFDPKLLFKKQPLDKIKQYFGVKVALYFTWAEYFTHRLWYLVVAGFVVIGYGVLTLSWSIPT